MVKRTAAKKKKKSISKKSRSVQKKPSRPRKLKSLPGPKLRQVKLGLAPPVTEAEVPKVPDPVQMLTSITIVQTLGTRLGRCQVRTASQCSGEEEKELTCLSMLEGGGETLSCTACFQERLTTMKWKLKD